MAGVELTEEDRARLRALARRVLQDAAQAEDVAQEAELRWTALNAEARQEIRQPQAWLATVAIRLSLDIRRRRRPDDAEALDMLFAPDPGPEEQVALADALALAMGIVMDRLGADERVAFILHDSFGFPFSDIAALLGRSDAAARKLASRARNRLRMAEQIDGAAQKHRAGAEAFLAAARSGDIEQLLSVLHPEVRFVDIDGVARVGPLAVAETVLPYRARNAVLMDSHFEVRAPDVPHFALHLTWRDGLLIELRRELL